MKKMFMYLGVIILGLGFIACSNDDNDEDNNEKIYRVSKITARFHIDVEDGDESCVYNYDNQGKIIKCICNGDYVITYTYKGDQIIVSEPEEEDENVLENEILQLNEEGYVSQSYYEVENVTRMYTYDELGQILKIEYTDGDIYNFTWNEGNIVKVVAKTSPYDIITNTYTYSSVENKADFDFASYLSEYKLCGELYNGLYFGKPNKNLVLTCQEEEGNDTCNYRYEYTFNENGCVEKILQYEDDILTITHIIEYL
ncbi:MAG: hypothetical protein V8R91_16820 [Butyricimonas faecihominis]|uniref:DUF4595 domain-containing protein n=1 Tax=Butyricimonas faecihominis TaxID=1472416 RepID=UPI00306AD045